MDLPIDQIMKRPLFAWLPRSGMDMLANCFNMEAERIPAGEKRSTRGRIGYLLSGCAIIPDGQTPVGQDNLLGVRCLENHEIQAEETSLTAVEACCVLWMEEEILTSVCYRACWFHGRFITEMKRMLFSQQDTNTLK